MEANHDYSKFAAEAPSADSLAVLASLAEHLYLAEQEVELKTEELREAQRKLLYISGSQIPELMDEVGMSEFTTTSGIKIAVRDNLRVSPPAARRQEVYDWLEARGYGDLVKHNVTAGFGKEESAKAEELVGYLEGLGLPTKDERKVESQTLKKFVKEQLAEGNDIPLDLFGAHEFRQTKITAKPESVFGD